MVRAFGSLFRAVIGWKAEESQTERLDEALLREVESAHGQWQAALAYCDQVTNPTDIDYAIYHLKSAQQRYVNLWQQAKRLGICAWDLPFQEIVLNEFRGSGINTDSPQANGSNRQVSAEDE